MKYMILRHRMTRGVGGNLDGQGHWYALPVRYGCGVLALLLTLGVAAVPADAATNILNLTANILQSTCTVTPDQTAMDLGDVRSQDIVGTTTGMAGFKPLTLTLSGCGLGMTGKTPALTLGGNQALLADVTKSNEFMFRDAGTAGGTSSQFFVVVGKVSNPVWNNSATGLYGVVNNKNIPVVGTNSASGATGEGATATVWVGVGCGATTFCTTAGMKAGTLKASLTFTMAYK